MDGDGVLGIHHITAIASDPQRDIDFYAGALGLRHIKRTVNLDDPGTYHLCYGGEAGTPGTILTFPPWPGAPRGRHGNGQATFVSFAIAPASMPWWIDRPKAHGVEVEGPYQRGDEEVLGFFDRRRRATFGRRTNNEPVQTR